MHTQNSEICVGFTVLSDGVKLIKSSSGMDMGSGCEIDASHVRVAEDSSLLGCDAVSGL
jgi:hypothetical protein